MSAVQFQIVLYKPDITRLQRAVESAVATAQLAMSIGAVSNVILVVGDCSPTSLTTDARREIDAAIGGALTWTYEWFEANLGSAGGQNRLATGATADALFLMNADTYAAPTMLTELVRVLNGDDAIVAAEARQIPCEHPKQYDLTTGETSWACGGCVLVRTEAFAHVAGFDADHFPLYGDDVDLCWRLRAAGGRIVHVPQAVIAHDKRIGPTGGIVPTEREQESGALARLLLAHCYGRPDVVASALDAYRGDPCEPLRRAADEFERRQITGKLPPRRERAHQVAQFAGDGFAIHRF